MDQVTQKSRDSPFKNFIAGGFGGVCTVVSGHPLDTIKVRLQTMPTPKPGEKAMYAGTFDCARKTVRHEGFRGLYKGMGAPLVGAAPIFAISFFGYGCGKKILRRDDNRKLSHVEIFTAGAFSGILTTTVMAPGERIKTLLQVQQGSGNIPHKYSGPIDVVKDLYKRGGIRSIFKGSLPTLLRDSPGSGVYYLTYEWVKEALTPKDGSSTLTIFSVLLAGGAAGINYWVVGTPADVIKSRLQSAPEGKYDGMRSVFKELIRDDGPMGLYKGVAPVMMRAFFANAACFIGFEFANKILNRFLPGL